jgi:hypothetical protein
VGRDTVAWQKVIEMTKYSTKIYVITVSSLIQNNWGERSIELMKINKNITVKPLFKHYKKAL